MKRLSESAKCFLRSEDGATLVEYGLLIGLLSVVAIGSVVGLASYVNGVFDQAQSEMATSGMRSK